MLSSAWTQLSTNHDAGQEGRRKWVGKDHADIRRRTEECLGLRAPSRLRPQRLPRLGESERYPEK